MPWPDEQGCDFDDTTPLFHTYVIYTMEEGVFYVGIGDDARLRGTIAQPKRERYSIYAEPGGTSPKFLEMERRLNAGQAIIVEPVFSSINRAEVEQCERDLIACYGEALTNVTYKDRKNERAWLPPGMAWQQFPLRNCSECLHLYQMKMQAQHRWEAQRFKEEIDQGAFITSRDIFWERAGEYYRHTQSHAQVVPRGTPLGVEPPPTVLLTTWLSENYPCVDLEGD